MRSDLQIAAHLAALNEPRGRYFTGPDGSRWYENYETGQTHPVTTPHDRRDGDQEHDA